MEYQIASRQERLNRLLGFVRPMELAPILLDQEDWTLTTFGVEALKQSCWQRSLVVNSRGEVLGFVCGAGRHQYGVGCSTPRDKCPVARKWDGRLNGDEKRKRKARRASRHQPKLEELAT